MIVNNKHHVNDSPVYNYPLSVYFGAKYSFLGNILIDVASGSTTLYIDLPYISRDAGVIFKCWFFEKLKSLLTDISNQKFFISGNNINQKILVKSSADAVIVNPDTKKICSLEKGLHFPRNNGTYTFSIVFPNETLPDEMCELIETHFYETVNFFRIKNNEDPI